MGRAVEQLENLIRLPWPWESKYEEADRRLVSPMSDATWGAMTRKRAAALMAEQKAREVNWKCLRKVVAHVVAEDLGVDVDRAHKLMGATAALTRMRSPRRDPARMAELWWRLIRFAQEGGTVSA